MVIRFRTPLERWAVSARSARRLVMVPGLLTVLGLLTMPALTGCGASTAAERAGLPPLSEDRPDSSEVSEPAGSTGASDSAAGMAGSTVDDGSPVPSPRSGTGGGVPAEDESESATGAGSEAAETPVAVILKAGGVDDAFVDVIESLAGIEWLSMVDVGQIHLVESRDHTGALVDAPPPGYSIQLEARAYDAPGVVTDFEPDLVDELARVDADEVILSASSAELRRLDVGGLITVDNGSTFTVAAVLPDDLIGSSEVVFVGPNALERAGAAASARRLAFVGYSGTGPELEAELLAASGGEGVRVFGGRGNGDRDRQRTTLPAIRVKEIFGEFAFRPGPGPGGSIEIDPEWTAANLVTVDLPLLGQAKCHRIFAGILTEVLQGLIDDGLSEVIDPESFLGCWNPRRIAGSTRLSKHSWGMAADLNFGNPPDGDPGSPVHPELIRRMLDADVISGHLWTASPDPGHFEYRGP